ncbi:MAG: Ppx/GppA family phosphatase, partial [Coriobacteriia bacterium]|nr:Ppx/GppA family phosphatase [Coriobacteriia bacterium]
AVATSAMRDASNSAEIIALLAEQGITVEVIAGAREAELSFKGTLSGFPRESNEHAEPAIEPSVSSIMTIDVGGGSTEVIFGRYDDDAVSHPNLLIEKAISFNIGSRRVTDRFLHSDPPTVDELAAARAWIEAEIKPFFYDCPKTPRVIYAVAGVATTAVSILEEMREYDRDRVHGTTISTEVFDRMLARLAAMPLAARREVVGLHPQRASVIVGGCITLSCMLHAVQADDFIVSETDILNGILLV